MDTVHRRLTIIKGAFGWIGAFGLAASILIFVRDKPPGGGSPLPISMAIFPGIFGLIAILGFIYSEWRLRILAGNQTQTYWRNAIIAFIASLFIIITLIVAD